MKYAFTYFLKGKIPSMYDLIIELQYLLHYENTFF